MSNLAEKSSSDTDIAAAIATLNYLYSLEVTDDVRAWLRRSREAYLSGSGFQDADDLEAYLDHCADDVLAGLTHLGPIAIVGARRLRELAARPIDWAWKDYVVSGTIVVVAGPPGGGKTTFLFLVLLARAATGEPIEVFGRQIKPAPAGKYVVLIEGEHGEASTARKLVKSAGLLGLGDDALDRIIVVARKAVQIGSKAWKDVETLIEGGLVSDVAVDTLARCAPADANNEEEQAKIFDLVARALEKAPNGEHPTAWLLVHTRKSGAEALQDVSGSAQRTGQADSVLMVDPVRDGNGQVISSNLTLLKAREDPEVYPEARSLAIEGNQIVAREKFVKANVKPEDLARVKAAIEALESGEFIVGGDIAGDLSVRKATVYAAIRELQKPEHGALAVPHYKDDGKTVNGWTRA